MKTHLEDTRKPVRKMGLVVSTKAQKTAVVAVTREYAHPVYGKRVKHVKKYHAHDEKSTFQVGDAVTIELTRPISKLKCWRVVDKEELLTK